MIKVRSAPINLVDSLPKAVPTKHMEHMKAKALKQAQKRAERKAMKKQLSEEIV